MEEGGREDKGFKKKVPQNIIFVFGFFNYALNRSATGSTQMNQNHETAVMKL